MSQPALAFCQGLGGQANDDLYEDLAEYTQPEGTEAPWQWAEAAQAPVARWRAERMGHFLEPGCFFNQSLMTCFSVFAVDYELLTKIIWATNHYHIRLYMFTLGRIKK